MVSYPSSFYGPALLLLVPEQQCVCGHRMTEIKEKLWLQENFCRFFFSKQIKFPTHYMSQPHTAITARVWKWSCGISALLWGEGILQVLFLAKFCCPGRSISKIYSTFLTPRSFLKFPTVMNAITALNPSLQRGRDFSYWTWICQRHKSFLGRIMDLGVHWKSHFGKAIQ